MNIIATYSHQPWNKGKLVGQKAPLPERYLGDPSETVNRRENPRSGTLRFSHRQQTASLRFNQAPCARRCSWRALVIASHRNAAENSSPSLVAESAVTKAQLANAAKQVDTNRKLELLDASHFILLFRLSDMSDSHLQALLAQEAAEGRFSDDSAQIAQHHARARRINLHRYERKDLAHWMEKHVYLALGSLISRAAALGIDAVPMEHFDQASVDAAFQLPQHGRTGVLLVALGYRSRDNGDGPGKSRLPAERIFMFR